jgi:alpha-D-ribose 1-methylphosphonate 5-triphosphate diphosphatase PhnM
MRKGGGMSAAELEVMFVSEMDRVEQWRQEELARAGYDCESALVLAASHDVDLHEAVQLLRRGCTIDLALQILL